MFIGLCIGYMQYKHFKFTAIGTITRTHKDIYIKTK